MTQLLTVLAGALLFTWPAALNLYPILFSDTGGFLEQALMPDIGWDKPWIYGPFLTPFHLKLTLWPVVFGQAIILSAFLWIAQTLVQKPRKTDHVALCAILTAVTAAPWFVSLVMPDIFAPILVVGLFILAFGHPTLTRWTLLWVGVATTIAIASHLAHLVLAAACIAALVLLRWRLLWRPALPLAAALALLLSTNIVGNNRVAISPFGAVFALARLIADGPARDLIDRTCPEAGYRLCAWKGRLPSDSDDFLWAPNGPVWANSYGPILVAPEAAAIVAATIAAEPGQVLAAALRNTGRQLIRATIGDILGPDHLAITIIPRLAAYFPPAETGRFQASLQARGALAPIALKFNSLYTMALLAGTLGTLLLAVTQWRANRPMACFAILTLVALVANAASTGALSGPHDRYQARIAWLVLVPPCLYALARLRRPATANPEAAPRLGPLPPPPATGGSFAG